jgi:hypothetical protein
VIYTQLDFRLPQGLITKDNQIHREGKIRAATGKDEIIVQKDHQVQEFYEYGIFLMLSRVIGNIGNISPITPTILEQLFLPDFNYLKNLYSQINPSSGEWLNEGEYLATPWINYIKR